LGTAGAHRIRQGPRCRSCRAPPKTAKTAQAGGPWEIYSRPDGTESWTRNAGGVLARGSPRPADLTGVWPPAGATETDLAGFYDGAEARATSTAPASAGCGGSGPATTRSSPKCRCRRAARRRALVGPAPGAVRRALHPLLAGAGAVPGGTGPDRVCRSPAPVSPCTPAGPPRRESGLRVTASDTESTTVSRSTWPTSTAARSRPWRR